MQTPENQINPYSYYEKDHLDYEVYSCNHCHENLTLLIYKDSLSSGNVCEECLSNPELGEVLGMTRPEFERYQNKCRTLKPIN
jgi:hypothetical protein